MSETNETTQAQPEQPQEGQTGRGNLADFVARGQSAQHAVNEVMPGETGPQQAGPIDIGTSEASGAHGQVGSQAGADAQAHHQKPSVGRIVHFRTPENAAIAGVTADMPFAAIITRVHSDEIVDLTVFLPGGASHGFSSAVHGEHWHWPPRVV